MKSIATLALSIFFSLQIIAQCNPPTAMGNLDINNVSAMILNGGDLWWDFASSKYEVPKGSGKTALFSGSIWISGYKEDSTLSTAALKYRQLGNDYWPGPLDSEGTTATAICSEFDRVWNVKRSEIEAFIAGGTATDDMILWPAKGNPNFDTEIKDLAPFYDENGDGEYNTVDGDYPMIKGDQAVFAVFNDMGSVHTESGGNPFGIEIHLMAYAYATTDDVNNATYYDYQIINKSDDSFNDVFIGQFTDVDLGNSQDDYVGVDVSRNMGYVYNGDDYDQGNNGYGFDLPIVGIRMNHTPNGEEMHNFTHLFGQGVNYGLPSLSIGYYNYLSGKTRIGGNRYDADSNVVLHHYSGTPGSANSMCSESILPGDYKTLQSYGPMDIAPNDIISFSYSVVYAQDASFSGTGCPDISVFTDASDVVDDNYQDDLCALFDPELTVAITPALASSPEGIIKIVSTGVEGAFSYAWSNGGSGRTISGLAPGEYTVTMTSGYGCEHIETFEVGDSSVGIDELSSSELKVFPNPTTGLIQLSPAPVQGDIVRVNDALGHEVFVGASSSQLDLSSLAPGMYVLSVNHRRALVQITR